MEEKGKYGKIQTLVSETEYKSWINQFFNKFVFDPNPKKGEENEDDPEIIDLNVAKMIFKSIGHPISPVDLGAIEREIKKKEYRGVTYPQFEKLYLKAFPYNPDSYLKQVFGYFDGDGDGNITRDDMKRVVLEINSKFTDEDIEEIFDVFDDDGNGYLSFDEVSSIMC